MVQSMESGLRIEPIGEDQFESLLPMIAAYQGFYEAEDIRTQRNRRFFRRFIAPSDEGMLIGAWRGEELLGYACLYWHHSSTRAVDTVLMNDLYVDEAARGKGVGMALIEATAEIARGRGADHVEWSTRPDNEAAQRLYDSTGAEKSTWIEYELRL
jgi:GNAT superfamily N-acetyltransferase